MRFALATLLLLPLAGAATPKDSSRTTPVSPRTPAAPAEADAVAKLSAARQASRSAPDDLVLLRPDGSKMLVLGAQTLSWTVGRRTPDGWLQSACVDGPSVGAFVYEDAKPAPAPMVYEER